MEKWKELELLLSCCTRQSQQVFFGADSRPTQVICTNWLRRAEIDLNSLRRKFWFFWGPSLYFMSYENWQKGHVYQPCHGLGVGVGLGSSRICLISSCSRKLQDWILEKERNYCTKSIKWHGIARNEYSLNFEQSTVYTLLSCFKAWEF